MLKTKSTNSLAPSQGPREETGERCLHINRQAGSKQGSLLPFSDFGSALALSGLGDMHPHMAGQLALLSPPI